MKIPIKVIIFTLTTHLSEFIHSEKKPEKKSELQFSSDSFLDLFDADIRSKFGDYKNRKRSYYKRALNESLIKGIVGGDFKQYKPQPLLLEHTVLRPIPFWIGW